MRQLFCIILAFVSVNLALGQTNRYNKRIFADIDTMLDVEYAQADFLNNLIPLFADFNIHEGEALTESRPLYMDIFMPRGDTLRKRPVMLFAHSGAFLIGSRKNDDMLAMCDSFAQMGYVTATMDYRKGMGAITMRLFGALISLKVTKENGYRAIYRAAQDSKAAVRFLKHNAEEYRIDTTKIYMVGSSAGGITSLYNLYLDNAEEIPSDALKVPSLGNIDSVGIQGYGSKANAIASLWGAVEDLKIIEEEKSPVFLVHGEADEMVPFKNGIPLVNMIEPNPAYSLELPETFGSFCIDTALINRSIIHQNYFVPNEEHEFYGVNTGMFPEEGPNVYWDTIQLMLNNFFYDLVRPKAEFQVNRNGLEMSFSNTSEDVLTSEWNYGDGSLGIGKETLHTYLYPGEYLVKLTTCNKNIACDTISKLVKAGTSVSVNTFFEKDVMIYPNPVADVINVVGIHDDFDISIFSMSGRSMFALKKQKGDEFKVNDLIPGIYILKIEVQEEVYFRKIVKK